MGDTNVAEDWLDSWDDCGGVHDAVHAETGCAVLDAFHTRISLTGRYRPRPRQDRGDGV
jgi:hypothetical protein